VLNFSCCLRFIGFVCLFCYHAFTCLCHKGILVTSFHCLSLLWTLIFMIKHIDIPKNVTTNLWRLSSRAWYPNMTKVISLQSHGSPNFKNFKTQFWSPEKKWHLGVSSMAKHTKYYERKVVVSPKSWSWWILWVHVCSWFIHAPKVFQLHINQLVI